MLDKLSIHQNPCGKSKIKISLCRRKSYKRTYLGEIRSIFDQVRLVVSHHEVCLPKKPPTPHIIGEGLKVPQRNSRKKPYLFNMTRTDILAFFRISSQSNPSLKENNSSVNSLLLVLSKFTFLINGNFLHATVQTVFLRLRVFILIHHTVQWNMLTHS